jgi:hypothetical protein
MVLGQFFWYLRTIGLQISPYQKLSKLRSENVVPLFCKFLSWNRVRETVFSNISSTMLLVDFMLVASGGVLIFRKILLLFTRVKYSKWVQKPAKFALERPRNQIQARYIQTGSDKWIWPTMLLVDFMLVASGGVLIFRKILLLFTLSILLIILNFSTMSDLNLLYWVRPHLEYGSNIWSVMYKKEAIQIENVQRRVTKLVKKIYGRHKKLGSVGLAETHVILFLAWPRDPYYSS